MKNFLKRSGICISVALLIFNLCPAISAQSRAELVRITNDQGKSENVRLYENSYALLIGASNYNPGWNKLPGVNEDLKAVETVLKKQMFTVEKLIDPTSKNLLSSIDTFVRNYGLHPNNRLLIYFAGHGFTETDEGREFGYIVPVDAPAPSKDIFGFRQTAVTMDEMESVARKIRSKHALFVFDSCFSGTLLNARRSPTPTIISMKAAQPVRQFITAGTADQEVPDKSIFREQFVEGIEGEADRNGDGYVTASELADFLQEKVTNYTRGSQTPLYGKILDKALDKGDFIFITGEPSNKSSQKMIRPEPGTKRVDEEEVESPKKQSLQAQTLSVSRFTRTDMCLEGGESVSVTASGTITLGASIGDTDPVGKDSFTSFFVTLPIDKGYYIDKSFPLGALLCRFDYSEKWNYCSTSKTLRAEKKGCLVLEVNDNKKSDNDGEYAVKIKPL